MCIYAFIHNYIAKLYYVQLCTWKCTSMLTFTLNMHIAIAIYHVCTYVATYIELARR